MNKKIVIEKIFRNTSDKNGQPYVDKFTGKPQTRVSLDSEGLNYSAWDKDGWTANWNVGQTIDVEVESKEVNGRTFNNIVKKRTFFTDPSVLARLDAIEEKLGIGAKGEKPISVKDTFNDMPF